MRSFRLFAVGRLARDPELHNAGDNAYTRFCIIGNDYFGKDAQGQAREIATSAWFSIFGTAAETLAHTCRTGDQVIVEGQMLANDFVDDAGKKHYSYNFIADSFRAGAHGKATREAITADSTRPIDQ